MNDTWWRQCKLCHYHAPDTAVRGRASAPGPLPLQIMWHIYYVLPGNWYRIPMPRWPAKRPQFGLFMGMHVLYVHERVCVPVEIQHTPCPCWFILLLLYVVERYKLSLWSQTYDTEKEPSTRSVGTGVYTAAMKPQDFMYNILRSIKERTSDNLLPLL